jgi:putative selenate reductase
MMRELERHGAVFDLPLGKAFLGSPAHDFAVRFHGRRASSPFGPAAGPHAQMAQNVALAWLGGARIIELKTVQIDDRLAIPRPCIDMRTVGCGSRSRRRSMPRARCSSRCCGRRSATGSRPGSTTRSTT